MRPLCAHYAAPKYYPKKTHPKISKIAATRAVYESIRQLLVVVGALPRIDATDFTRSGFETGGAAWTHRFKRKKVEANSERIVGT